MAINLRNILGHFKKMYFLDALIYQANLEVGFFTAVNRPDVVFVKTGLMKQRGQAFFVNYKEPFMVDVRQLTLSFLKNCRKILR